MPQASHHEVLKSLARFETGASFAEFQKCFPPGVLGELAQTLDNLCKAQFIAALMRNGQLCYEVTAVGHKMLASRLGDEPLPAQPETVAPASVEVRRCPERPAVATVCLDEFSLNKWWEEQDVEVKANAFLLWTLGSEGAIAPEEDAEVHEVPLGGTVGADPQVIKRLHEAIQGRPVAQADGCGGEAANE
jgi:hypothetical protein